MKGKYRTFSHLVSQDSAHSWPAVPSRSPLQIHIQHEEGGGVQRAANFKHFHTCRLQL